VHVDAAERERDRGSGRDVVVECDCAPMIVGSRLLARLNVGVRKFREVGECRFRSSKREDGVTGAEAVP